jgi:hypothetical protein
VGTVLANQLPIGCDQFARMADRGSWHHLRKEIRMIDRKPARVIGTCSLAAYAAGQHLQYAYGPPRLVVLEVLTSTAQQHCLPKGPARA